MYYQLFLDSQDIQDKLTSRVGSLNFNYTGNWIITEEEIIREITFLFQNTRDPQELSNQLQDLVDICREVRRGRYSLVNEDTKYTPPIFKGTDIPLNKLLDELFYQERLVDEIEDCLINNTNTSLHQSLATCNAVIEGINEDLKKLEDEYIDPDLIRRAFNLECKIQQLTSC